MLKDVLQDEILVKTKEGDFKVLKKDKLEEVPSDELAVKSDKLSKPVEPVNFTKPAISNFYFHVDDEYDVNKLKIKGDNDKNRQIKEFIENVVENIVSQLNLPGAKDNLQFKNVIMSRLKDVRSLAETREVLMAPQRIGMSLGKEQIDRVLRLIEQDRAKVEQVIKTGKVPVDYALVKKLKEKEDDRFKKKTGEKIDVKYEKKYEIVAGKELPRHMTTGPIEEIKSLSLQEFRRLGESPAEAAGRVLEKISLLEDESLVKKAEGIKAWQESEVNKLYIAIGAASMAEKKSVEQVIREHRKDKKPYLTPEEFNQVADLNRKLLY